MHAILTITEDDLQEIARERGRRQMTQEELRIAVRCFENGIEWYEVAEIAVDEAMTK